MVWPFNSSKSTLPSSPSVSLSESNLVSPPDTEVLDSSTSGFGTLLGSDGENVNMSSLDKSPIFALDQLKHAGVPFEKQLSPYLQMDPSVFRESTPQYIVPGETKGELEFAMGRIGWAVLAGYGLGCLRGLLPELRNPVTRQLPFKPFMTRLMNSSVKHGSGFAHPAGSIVFMFSVANMIFGKLRARDDLNAIAAGAVTGGLFRCAHGSRASLAGSGIGAAVALLWLLSDRDSRDRLWEMRRHLMNKQEYSY
ncbi:unnamed protein product [Thelazia callipaeda]|uniref:Mitochondrial import inner membrane translocase subunit TIM23 n=1 Tax=Thelazia callipaeda TaxID=103827 RepID=A0A0N5CPF0_THECL|nr:unnamed protein product [Thelazia callipaeda]